MKITILILLLLCNVKILANDPAPIEPDQDILSVHVKKLIHCLYLATTTDKSVTTCFKPFSAEQKIKDDIIKQVENDSAVMIAKQYGMTLTETLKPPLIRQNQEEKSQWLITTDYELTLIKKEVEIIRPMQAQMHVQWNGEGPMQLTAVGLKAIGKEKINNYEKIRSDQCPNK